MKEGRLREVKRKPKPRNDRQKEWNSCLWRCIRSNKKIGVAAHMYKKKYGVWPQGLKTLPKTKTEWNMMAGEYYDYWTKQNVGNRTTA